jgi:hypothetical protein
MQEDLKETTNWYEKERNIKIDEFDDYDLHVCRVATAYHQSKLKLLNIDNVSKAKAELLIAFSEYLVKGVTRKGHKEVVECFLNEQSNL